MYIEQVSKFKEEIANIDADMTKMGKKWMKTMRTKNFKATQGIKANKRMKE